jgi:hypothetical protein
MSTMFGEEEEPKTADLAGYVAADCANCGRQRLELFVNKEKAVGIQCEKCLMRWPLDSKSGAYTGNTYGDWEID